MTGRKKYYFVTYEWRNVTNGGSWQKENAVMYVSPIVWLKDTIVEYPKQSTRILFYHEITLEEYELINGWIN